jgi:hypothetical protein
MNVKLISLLKIETKSTGLAIAHFSDGSQTTVYAEMAAWLRQKYLN